MGGDNLEARSPDRGTESVAIVDSLLLAVEARDMFMQPYPHALLRDVLPETVAARLRDLPFEAPHLNGVSGARDVHNETRRYFDAATMAEHQLAADIADAFQSSAVVGAFSRAFGAVLDGTFLRLEYALDRDGFWLKPHTDLGVKAFTCLVYLPDRGDQETLGTDIYASEDHHFGRTPFRFNSALIFVPGQNTWHGFEPRPIAGVRRSLILNYVTPAWRAREQLCFPDRPVSL